MHAVDTNVLVRIITAGDDAAQASRAMALMEKETIFITKTVLLETEWVLRRIYKIELGVVLGALRTVASTLNVEIEDADSVEIALDWSEDGMGFANALHLASSQRCAKFVTFDKGIKKTAPTEQKTRILQL